MTFLDQAIAAIRRIEDGEVVDLTNRLMRHPWKRYRKRSLDSIRQVVIHHSATHVGSPDAFARYHVQENGWPGIGYHFVISQDGDIWQTNALDTASYHVPKYNRVSVGICLIGNFMEAKPNILQKAAAASAIAHVWQQLGRKVDVKGHRDFNKPQCPGKNVDYEELARDAEKYFELS
ncbi:MAG: N-acetylmuramoyl-L-alanine amidase [Bacteroidetes bacterium]|nr:MAG: N-acetylmuramoyl-L-alanine amidase [Bacteroidota bacterium]